MKDQEKEDKDPSDLTFLIEQHSKEIWSLKEQLSNQSKELTVLRGTKQVVASLSNELVSTKKRVLEVEEDNKKLSKQIEEKNSYVQKLREQGII
jgi:septal ring factor EnvC (AmiA/AmiB activator)